MSSRSHCTSVVLQAKPCNRTIATATRAAIVGGVALIVILPASLERPDGPVVSDVGQRSRLYQTPPLPSRLWPSPQMT